MSHEAKLARVKAVMDDSNGDMETVLAVLLTDVDEAPLDEPVTFTEAPVFDFDVPEVAATPTAQGIVDALVELGLVTQAEA